MSITHDKHLNPLLNLFIHFRSPISAPQTLSIKGECTFLLLNFWITGLCNSFANCLLKINSFLTASPGGSNYL